MNYTKIAMQLNGQVGIHETAVRPLAYGALVLGHFFGGVVLFGAFDQVLRYRARSVYGVDDVDTEMALRGNGSAVGMGLVDVAIAGAAGGAAHAVATSPIVVWQRSGSLFSFAGYVSLARSSLVVIARDAFSFSSFFATFAAAFRPEDDAFDSFRAAGAGGLAGLVCHAVRFPIQTLYKRGLGWVDTSTLTSSALARRFFRTSGRAILSASLSFGVYEAVASLADASQEGDDRSAK